MSIKKKRILSGSVMKINFKNIGEVMSIKKKRILSGSVMKNSLFKIGIGVLLCLMIVGGKAFAKTTTLTMLTFAEVHKDLFGAAVKTWNKMHPDNQIELEVDVVQFLDMHTKLLIRLLPVGQCDTGFFV